MYSSWEYQKPSSQLKVMRESLSLVITFFGLLFDLSRLLYCKKFKRTYIPKFTTISNNYFPLKCETVTRFIWLDKHQMIQTLCSNTIVFWSLYVHSSTLVYFSLFSFKEKHKKYILSLRKTLPKVKCFQQNWLDLRIVLLGTDIRTRCTIGNSFCSFKLFIPDSQSSKHVSCEIMKLVW